MENTQLWTAPLLWVPGKLLLPETVLKLKSLTAERSKLYMEQEFVVLPFRKENAYINQKDIRLYGVVCKGQSAQEEADGTSMLIKALYRVRVSATDKDGETCEYTVLEEHPDLTEPAVADMISYIQSTVAEMAEPFEEGKSIVARARSYKNLNQLIAFLAQYLPLSSQECSEILSMNSTKARATRFLDLLLKQKETISLNLEMNEKLSARNAEWYRKMALEQQLKAIQDELAEDGDNEKDPEGYLKKIAASDMDEEHKGQLREEAEKLMRQSQGADAENIRNYLNFALSLPWKKEPAGNIDLSQASDILSSRHYGLEKVKQRILEQLAVMKLKNNSKGSAVLLVGPPGTGKTSLGKSIAQALGRPYVRMALGGVRDESEIRGHRRTYIGSMSGRVLKSMKQAGATNPVMILDEIDKMMAGGFSGDPAAAMLEVLDPEQNHTFTDHYLDMTYDLSDVFFIATANSLDTIPAPLLDRMEVIQVSSYTANEKFHIAKDHLVPEVVQEYGMEKDDLLFTDVALRELIDGYTLEAGCRGLKKQLASIVRQKAVDFAKDGKTIVIDSTMLQDMLGPVRTRHDKVHPSNPCGVVTGLAWTAVGGEVLLIETAAMPGNGKQILTGHLGDVMKESAQIALSVLKSRLPLDADMFAHQDIHIHFPAGATPKDGPSAGITMFTALASLVLQRPVDSHIAMTGELSLSGDVLPIGGLKEKLFGALRAGIRKVLIPVDNVCDLAEVDPEVLDRLEIVPVRTVEDVLRETLGIRLPALQTAMLADVQALAVL
jgi:ATP-dependent Lon protease